METELQLLLKLKYSESDHRENFLAMQRRRNWGTDASGVGYDVLDEYEKAYYGQIPRPIR